MEHMDIKNYSEINRFWDQQQEMLSGLYRGVPNYIADIEDLTAGFKLSDRSIRCMDEGAPGGVHMGGSGILLDKDAARQIAKEMKADGVYSHAGCGAAALYAKQNGLQENPDEYGKQWAQELAALSGIPYKGHITTEQMKRPAGFHIARTAYYDGSGEFDFSKVAALPPGFIISRKYFDPAYAAEELKIATQIALGDHGFGSLIDSDHPFLIIAVGNRSNDSVALSLLEEEARAVASAWGNRVVVDGFTSPI